MRGMTPHDAFLESIIAAPDDDAPRLIYADWLEENGEPERAEFIRVQCAIAKDRICRVAPTPCERCEDCKRWHHLSRREKELLNENGYFLDRIQAPWPDVLRFFKRGFVESVSCYCADWLKHGPAIVRSAPIREVRLADKHPSRSSYNRNRWAWFHEHVPLGLVSVEFVELDMNRISLSAALIPFVQGGKGSVPMCKWFDAESDALAALSQACILWARSQPATACPSTPAIVSA